jgi:hypothetical protein
MACTVIPLGIGLPLPLIVLFEEISMRKIVTHPAFYAMAFGLFAGTLIFDLIVLFESL